MAAHRTEGELEQLLSLLRNSESLSEEQLADLCILMDDFRESLARVQPFAKRDGFATVPDVTWDDVGALQDIREELTMAILTPLRFPEQFKAMGLSGPSKVLLAGPPGCGKTLLAKAVANAAGLNFIYVNGPELLNMSGASVRVLYQLLTEIDGLEMRRQVYIMAATTRPDIIDPAFLRPGRFGKKLYVGFPLPEDRHAILLTITKGGTKPRLDLDVNLEEIARDERCDCFTGADLSALVREALFNVLNAHPGSQTATAHAVSSGPCDLRVSKQNFEEAFKKVRPSVSKEDQLMYEKLRKSLTGQ
ncbi:nuclear valosin-containing protein-like isoform X5 [Tachysurus fulvidraco]|uniref:nuclear valosin-containing protein-like isoform X5 n=1 Tax=Tachysurus fulvidraco TaxID=1234273 RepID=UPI001FEE3E0A|nr:nuclear valosin-containing protein-like isoform X5 [Tachysurus fulvidraco]